jgi:hypothetical protein
VGFAHPTLACSTDLTLSVFASSEPGCSRDQKQSRPDDNGPGGSRDALAGRCETFDGDGCRDDRHRAQVHDTDDQEDRRQADTAVDAVEAET